MIDNFGARVAKIRAEMGMSKKKFAEMIGISPQYLGAVEKGEHGVTMQTLTALCQKADVSADYLLFGNASLDFFALKSLFSDYNPSQIQIVVEIMKKMSVFLQTDNINELLIKEIFKIEKDSFIVARPAI